MEMYGSARRNEVMAGQCDVMEQDVDRGVLLDDIL